MLDLIGSIVLAAVICTELVGVLSSIALRLSTKIAYRGPRRGLGWSRVRGDGRRLALATHRCASDVCDSIAGRGVLSMSFPSFRRVLLELPPAVIIRLHAFRVLGVFFLFLALADRLSGPFPYSAGIGDIITGILALPVAAIAAREGINDWRVIAWTVFGTLDLSVAVFLGVTSNNASPIQLIHAGVGSAAIFTLPWSLIPLVLVPVYLIEHVLVFTHLRVVCSGRDMPAR